jgi:DNA-binding transcriptional LysR family regulator
LDTRFLESLLKVIETGSIASAARAQGLTAAAVSGRVRALEAELRCPLLSRIGHTAVPTPACTRLIPRARRMVADRDGLRGDLQPKGLFGTLKLGAIATALTDYIPDVVQAFGQSAPDAELIVVPGSSASLYEQLARSDIDAAVLVKPHFTVPKQFDLTAITHQPPVLVSNDPGTFETLAETRPIILYDRTAWGGRLAWQWLNSQSPRLNVLCELDALETITIMVEQGLGFAVLPEWGGLRARHKVSVQSLDAPDQYARQICLMFNRATHAHGLIDLCMRVLKT